MNEDEHFLFIRRIGKLVCYLYNVWKKTPESNFQVTRGQ